MRSASVLDDGTVFFVSLARLAPADTNVLADYYRADAGGTVTAVDLPTGSATGHFFWGGTDAVGTTFYLFRQYPDPSQFELRFGTLANKTSLGVRSLVKAADFAAGGTHAVYECDLSGFHHLFLHDLTGPAATETLLTGDSDGDSRSPAISLDGDRIVFSSSASNLVPADANGVVDVYLYERAARTFTLVSQRLDSLGNADAVTPDISADGQVICFASSDDSFVPGDTNAHSDVFVAHDGVVHRCSLSSDGTQANADSTSPRLNANGRFVVFVSQAGNLVPGVSNGLRQVFLFDREGGRLEAISVDGTGTPSDADCFVPEIPADGRYVTFVSKATNLAPGVDGACYQVYRADRGPHYDNHPPTAQSLSLAAAKGTSIRFSLTATDVDQDEIAFVVETRPLHGTLTDADGTALSLAQAYGPARFPWHFVPADGSILTDSFTFRATDGKTASAMATVHVRMVDPDLGAVARLSVATDGTEGTQDSYLPYPGLGISADGSLVAFSSTAGELDPADDDNGSADIFLRDTVSGLTRLVTTGGARNENSYRCVLSGDGHTTVYYTEDGNALILQDLAGGFRGTVAAVSSYLSNSGPGISHDGMRVIYEKDGQVRLFERGLAATVRVSVNSLGISANQACGDIAISADGKVAAFVSTATNLADTNPAGVRSVYLRFFDTGQTVLISTTPSGQLVARAAKPELSATGRHVVFLADDGTVGDGIGTVYVKNVGSGELRQVAADAANPAISADGRFVCCTKAGAAGASQLYRIDLAVVPGEAQLVSNTAGLEGDGDSYRGVLSASGRFVAFASKAANLVAGDTNGKSDIFLNDFGIPPNDLPVPTLATVTTDEDTPLVDIPLTYNDTEGNDVRTEIVSGPAHAAQFAIHALRPGEEAATFTYAPLADFNGQDSFTYRCGDAEGWSAPVTVTITVSPVNDPPRWIGIPALWGMQPDQEFTLDLSRFVDDPDTSDPDPDSLRFSLLQGAPEARIEGCALIISAAGTAGTAPIILRLGVADREHGPVIEFGEELSIHVRAPVEIPLHAGWNLISFPMMPEPSAPALLLTRPGTARAESLYIGPVWYWNAETGCYRSATTLEPKRAYWVHCSEPASVPMQVVCVPPADPTVAMLPGWNLVGPVGFGEVAIPTWVADGSPVPWESIWGWNGANYAHSEQSMLECGQGYWIHSCTAQAADMGLVSTEE
jgi:Tol biopolymer transport system component